MNKKIVISYCISMFLYASYAMSSELEMVEAGVNTDDLGIVFDMSPTRTTQPAMQENSCAQRCQNICSSDCSDCCPGAYQSLYAPSFCSRMRDGFNQGYDRGYSCMQDCCDVPDQCKLCCLVTAGGVVLTGLIVGILVATGDMNYNRYHIENATNRPIALRIRGNSYNCKDVYYTTDSDGNRHRHTVPKDCRKYLFPGDRVTLLNYGYLTKLGAYYYDYHWDYEYGHYEHVTDKGLKDFDWVVHAPSINMIFTRKSDYESYPHTDTDTHHELPENDFKSYQHDQQHGYLRTVDYITLPK